MKTICRVVAPLLSLLLAVPTPVFAVSLYDGLNARPEAPVAPTPIVPGVAAIPELPAGLPASIDASLTAPTLPTLPTIPPIAAAAQIPQIAQPAQSARPAQSAAGSLDHIVALTANAVPDRSGSEESAPRAAAEAFDGSFVQHGVDQFFGTLSGNEEPGVVTAKTRRDGSGIEAAPTDGEMNDNVKSSPKTARERENAAGAMFQRGGAAFNPSAPATAKVDLTKYDTVQFQDAGRGKRNVVVVKKGKSDRIIVVGSHNDKVEVGDGVIDNWTGTTMVAHLYQTIKDQPTDATIVFIAHAREEEGLLGSRKFVSSLSREELKRVEANINIDTLAIKGGGTLVWDNGDGWASAKDFLDAADRAVTEENAKRSANDQLVLKREPLNGGDADSSSYRDAGVPWYGTFFGGSEDLIFSIIHTPRDNFGAFSLPIYRESYFVTLAVLRYLDAHGIRVPGINS
jgi:hypothetical protein